MSEEWLSYPRAHRYLVSRRGVVLGPAGKVLTASPDSRGRRRVRVYTDQGARDVFVHVMVLETHVGPRPPGMEALHWDDDAGNNDVSNLRWGTHADNMQDRIRNGHNPRVEQTHCVNGHEFTPANTYRKPDGNRACVPCKRRRLREWRRRRARDEALSGSRQ